MVKYLKVPENIVKIANEKGILTELEFYYKIKSLRINGFYFCDEINGVLSKKLKLSYSYVYKSVERLIRLGWLKRKYNGFQIIKYDDLFKWFGYDMSLKFGKRCIRRGKFKIFKINSSKIKTFILEIAKKELNLNFARQRYCKFIQKKRLVSHTNEITMSVRSVANLLGFTSSSTGKRILDDLEELGYVRVFKRMENNLPRINLIFL